jgi:succinyldiaminopimelate transaminase
MRDLGLPEFPWDTLTPYAAKARAHEGNLVDLSVGTPVDPTPALVQRALAAAADAPGYPQTYGTPDLREAVAAWFARRRGVPDLDPDGVLPTIGSKELVGLLPTLLGLGPGDIVVHPEIAYPSYDIGARLAGAEPVAADGTAQLGPRASRVRLLWLNSPSNPTGRVLGVEHLAKVVDWARRHDVVVASDECYAELGWTGEPVPSILDPAVNGGRPDGLLAVYSLSKQSNLAGYRAAFVAGDVALVRRLLEVRKHAGLMVPWPVQRAMLAALRDDDHVAAQRDRYAARRARLIPAMTAAGFTVELSQAGLYLWCTRGEDCWTSVEWLADRGILVAPGAFYGPAGARHVRVALTATDERVAVGAERLTQQRPAI